MWKRKKKQHLSSMPQALRDEDRPQTELPRSSPLEWQFLREGEVWDDRVAIPANASTDLSKCVGRVRSIRAIAVLLIVLLASVTLYLWRRAESGAQILEEELRATIAAEAQLASPLGSGQDERVLPSPATILQLQSQGITLAGQADRVLPSPVTTVQVQDLIFHGDVVSVQVESTYTEPDRQSYILRQRRFYYLTDTGWVRVPPYSAYLGALLVHETKYFTFEYRKMDAATVEEIAGRLDAIYTDLRKDFALPSTDKRIVVRILADPSEEDFTCYRTNYLCVNSPALTALPINFTESEALQLWIVHALANRVRWEALKIQPLAYGWHHIIVALSLVQIRQHSTIFSARHTEIMHWFYGTAMRTPKPDENMLAQELARLCDAHQINALGALFVADVPVHLCIPTLRLDLHSLIHSAPPDRLSQLIKPYPSRSDLRQSWIEVLACETLLDYVIITYGREALPALAEGFRQYASWNTLAPAVFGITAEEFELGWQEYLQNLY